MADTPARDELFAYCGYTPEDAPLLALRIDDYRAEVLRETRRAVLAASLAGPADPNAGETWTRGYRAGLSVAADLTTPARTAPEES